MRYKGVTKFMAGLLAAAMVVTGIPVATLDTAEAKSKTEKLSYKGYTKVWEDNFDGNALNMKDWNVETHEPGWVNAELQEYTESGNIKVSDGKLTIIPKRTKNADGTYSYTSGRINTQNKHDFKYGIMEARMKFPKGQGYLPAFWMMPTNENLYGQWPKCGEIDIAEVMGQDTKKIYGTIHYGEPHAQSQGTEVLKKGNFADDWHTCAVEWEPGSIKWYVDGVLYHEEHSWFTKTPGQGEVTYPAPFDQNFYIIFNLAIGGSWVGYPDKTTDYNSNFQVDYVKVYQKKNYSENVKKPEKKVVLKKADKKGNFISNADFSKDEKLDGSANWQFMTAQSGEGSAAIKNKKIEIKTKNAGKEEYSIQLVQPGLPMEKGATYEVSFDAYADKARTMKVDISGPDMNYMRYFNDTAVNLTTKKKSYKFKFTMNEDTDANSRLEFNMGAQGSTANVYITNVKVKKVKSATKAEANKKTVLADGNLVYNGKFQEGDKRLGYWNVKKKNATVAVSNKDYNDRKLVVKLTKDSKAADVKVYQTGLAFEANKEYSVSFDANASDARSIKVRVAGKTFTAKLNKATKNYEFIMKTGKKLSDKSVIFSLGGKKGTVCIDNVVVTENSLIKNGSFNAGTTGWTEWHDTSEADLSFVIDSLSEDNAADFTIKKTGSEDWKIQLKQENVPLEKDQYYKLTFKAKSSKTREMRAIMQGLEDKGWAVYSGENTVKLTSKYKTYTKVFQMTADSDPKSQISFCLGAVGGKSINTQHRVCIDDVNLEIISEEEAKKYIKKDDSAASEEVAGSLIANGSFNDGVTGWTEWHDTNAADASFTVTDKAADMTINKTGTEDWHVQLKQDGITLTKGKLYRLKFNAKSTKERKIRAIMQGGESKNYEVYSGENIVTVTDKYKTYSKVFEMTSPTDTQVSFGVNFGKVDGKVIEETHHVYIDDVSLVELTDEEAKAYKEKHAGDETSAASTSSVTPVPSPSPTSEVSKLSPEQMQAATKTANGAAVSHATTRTGKTQTIINNNGGATPGDIKDAFLDASKVKSGVVSKIEVPISWASGTTVQGLRRGRLMSGPTTYSVQFAWIDSSGNELEKLTDIDGNTEISISQEETTVNLISGVRDASSGATLACYIGGVDSGNSVLYGDIKVTEMTNLLGKVTNWSNGWEAGYVNDISAAGGTLTLTEYDDGAKYVFNNSGTAEHHLILCKNNMTLKKGAIYEYSFTVEADEWNVVSQVLDTGNGYADLATDSSWASNVGHNNGKYPIKVRFEAKSDSSTARLGIQFGKGVQGNGDVPAETTKTVEIRNLQMVMIKDATPSTPPEEPQTPVVPAPAETSGTNGISTIIGNLFAGKSWTADGVNEEADKTNSYTVKMPESSSDQYYPQIKMGNVSLKQNHKYIMSVEVLSSVNRKCMFTLKDPTVGTYGTDYKGSGDFDLVANEKKVINLTDEGKDYFTVTGADSDSIILNFFLGKYGGDTWVKDSTIRVSDVKLVDITESFEANGSENGLSTAEGNKLAGSWSDGDGNLVVDVSSGKFVEFKIKEWDSWWPATNISNVQLDKNKNYTVTMDVISTEKRKLHIVAKGKNGATVEAGGRDLGAIQTEWLNAGEKTTISFTFDSDASDDDMNKMQLAIFLAQSTLGDLCESDKKHTVFISNVSVVETP